VKPRDWRAAVLGLILTALVASSFARSALAPRSDQRLPNGQRLLVLCYHDVVPARSPGMDPESIETAALAQQLNWLRTENFVAVDLDAVVRAYDGKDRLPDRAVLLTFDDGYSSAYTQVFPLLQAFRMPAVMALVGQWMEQPDGSQVQYGDQQLSRDHFLTWVQARRMQASGLIEFVSHSWNLHRTVVGDSAHSRLPAATSNQYLGDGHYETDDQWLLRVRSDLERNSDLLTERLGRRPRAIVWPYGRYNSAIERIAQELGMPIGLTLDVGRNDHAVPISRMRRLLIDAGPALDRFGRLALGQDDAPVLRALQLDLGQFDKDDPAHMQKELDTWVARIRRLGVSIVLIPAHAAPDVHGRVSELYFRNRRLPVRRDLLGPVAWKLASTTGVRVWVLLPTDSYATTDADPRQTAADIFEDLGKSVYLNGLVLQSRTEPVGALESDPELVERVRKWQPQLLSAWWSAPPATPAAATRLDLALKNYDYLLFGGREADGSFDQSELTVVLRSIPDARSRILVVLATDGRSAPHAARQARALEAAGLPNLVFAADDFDGSVYDVPALRPVLSTRSQLLDTNERQQP
jgi:poly-beta-1,6-N-acetyl-D-glucosamine N-deacetylase